MCSTEFEPIIRPEISVVDIDNKKIVAVRIDVLAQRNKPCYYKPKGLHNGSYIRVGDRDDNMSEYEIYKCISYRDNVRDDLKPVLKASIKDFDEKLLNKFIANAKADKPKFAEFSDEEILLQYGALTEVEDKIFPTVAGIMVFGIYPQKFFPQWFVAAIVGNIFGYAIMMGLYRNILPKTKYSHYSSSSHKSVYVDDVDNYVGECEVHIGQYANCGKNRALIEKIYKVTRIIVLVQLAISIILFFILK